MDRDELDDYQGRAMRQLENITGIQGRIAKEEAKAASDQNQEKLKNWRKELNLTEKAFQRMQVLI